MASEMVADLAIHIHEKYIGTISDDVKGYNLSPPDAGQVVDLTLMLMLARAVAASVVANEILANCPKEKTVDQYTNLLRKLVDRKVVALRVEAKKLRVKNVKTI